MTVTLPTQEQVNQVVAELAPDVVRIRMDIATDWAGEPAIYFRGILSDEAGRRERFREVIDRAEAVIRDRLGLDFIESHFPYFSWRMQSEQVALRESSWE